MRLGPERTVASRLRARVESFLSAGSVSYEKNYLIVRPIIAISVIVVALVGGLPGAVGVILAASCAIIYNFLFAFLLAQRKYMAERALSLVFDNLTVIAGSLWVNWKMGAAGYENDLWLVFIPIIVSNSLYYGPVASLFFTTLWTGLFVAQTLLFYDADSYYREQLPTRLVFFVLTGFVSYSLSAELRQRRQNLERKSRQSLQMLAQIVEARDTDAGLHLRHIQYYSRALALRLGVDEQQADEIAYAAMIHDVGKAQVADSILKKAGPLTPEERQEIQKHTVWADAVLSEDEEFATAREVARHHHERWDGTGYPDKIRGDDIPFAARILTVADVWDALTTTRSYRPAFDPSKAFRIMKEESGTTFDPDLVPVFETVLESMGVLRHNLAA
jgi:HD domain